MRDLGLKSLDLLLMQGVCISFAPLAFPQLFVALHLHGLNFPLHEARALLDNRVLKRHSLLNRIAQRCCLQHSLSLSQSVLHLLHLVGLQVLRLLKLQVVRARRCCLQRALGLKRTALQRIRELLRTGYAACGASINRN